MDRTQFRKPVSVLVGLGYPAKIESASQAYQLLNELPLPAGNPARSVAAKVCRLAIEGAVDPEVARSAFIAFASRMAMLAGDASSESDSLLTRPLGVLAGSALASRQPV